MSELKWGQVRFERGADYQKIYPNFCSSCLAQWTLNASELLWVSVWDRGCWVEFSVSGFPPEGAQAVSRNTQSTHPELSLCLLLSPCPLHTEAVERNNSNGGVGKRIPSSCPPQVPYITELPSFHQPTSLCLFLACLLTLALSFLRNPLCYFSHEFNKSKDSSLSKWGTSPGPDGCL